MEICGRQQTGDRREYKTVHGLLMLDKGDIQTKGDIEITGDIEIKGDIEIRET